MRILDKAGNPIHKDSPERTIWYGDCGYWTDDWDKLTIVANGIPVCPICGIPGYYGTAREFLGPDLDTYNKHNPGYKKYLLANKEKCKNSEGGIIKAFRKYKIQMN